MIYFITEAAASQALLLPVLNAEMGINSRGLVLQAAARSVRNAPWSPIFGRSPKATPNSRAQGEGQAAPAGLPKGPVPAPGNSPAAAASRPGERGAGALGCNKNFRLGGP